eukprot:scpid10574/ scgid8485/ Protein Hook homolog 3
MDEGDEQVAVFESLLVWLRTFGDLHGSCETAQELSDGVALSQALHQIVPDWFDDEWLGRIKVESSNNRRIRISNVKKVISRINEYYDQVLRQQITDFEWPDAGMIGDVPSVSHLTRLLQLILGVAISCDQKEVHIQNIMLLEESVQHFVMGAIQELLRRQAPTSVSLEVYKQLEEENKSIAEQLSEVMNDKDGIAQRCYDLEQERTTLQEERDALAADNQRLRDMEKSRDETDSGPSEAHQANYRQQQLTAQIEQMTQEKFEMEAARDDFRQQIDDLQRTIAGLRSENKDLTELAESAQKLADERDEFQLAADKLRKFERQIESYKLKLDEANSQKKAAKDQCDTLSDRVAALEEDSRLASVAKVQAESYRQRLEKFEKEIDDERKKADRAEFEARKATEQIRDQEKEIRRLQQEVETIQDQSVEMHMSHNKKGFSLTDELSSVSDMQQKDRVHELEKEVEALRLSPANDDLVAQLQVAQSSVDDITAQKEKLQQDNRSQNQRIMELESKLESAVTAASRSSTSSPSHPAAVSKTESAAPVSTEAKRALAELRLQNKQMKSELEQRSGKYKEAASKVSNLQEALVKKDKDMKAQEQKYKRYIDKAKSVIENLTEAKEKSGQHSSSAEVGQLNSRLQEKSKRIESLEKDQLRVRQELEREQRIMASSWYEMCKHVQRKAAEERLSSSTAPTSLSSSTPGASFLARQRQGVLRTSLASTSSITPRSSASDP